MPIFCYENIPIELKQLKQWVCWCGDKVPKNAYTGRNAQSDNPDTWSTFEEAIEAVKKYHFDGVGFMFANGYFGVDIDNSMDKRDLLDEFVDYLQSYAEISRSGNGIHIICKGQLPLGARRKDKIEMYQSGRYFIMTGNIYTDEPLPILDCTEQIKPLHAKYLSSMANISIKREVADIYMSDDDLVEKARSCASGGVFQLLLRGEWEGLYDSQSEADLAFCNHLAFWTQKKADQMDKIFRSSGLMREKWDRKQAGTTYGYLTIQKAITGTGDVYDPTAKGGLVVIRSGTKSSSSTSKIYAYTDTGNAQRLVDMFGDNIRYSYQNKTWIFWDGKKWQDDSTGEIKRLADMCLDEMRKQAFALDDKERQEEMLRWVHRSSSSKGKTAMITESQHIGDVPVLMDAFDKNKDLLNCQNGIVNLRNGELIAHDPNYMLSKISYAEYNPTDAVVPERWLKFLDEITDGNKELQKYIQTAIGYSLTGSIREQCLFFCHGNGNNGKSTFLDIISNVLGSYASNAQSETVMASNKYGSGGGASTDIARLKGARFVTTVEANEGVKLNEGLIKQLTGGDKVTARFLYGREFEYIPEFKLWLGANHKPIIRGTDLGIWRRIHLIPFTVQIAAAKIDKGLRNKLLGELPHILKWAVDGCMMWLKDGLEIPECVRTATEEYKQEMDILAQFCELCITTDYTSRVKAGELYDIYCHWADENHEYKMSNAKFGKEFLKKFPEKVRTADGYAYRNISFTQAANHMMKQFRFGNFYGSSNSGSA